jgi:hypothetical protein
MLSVNSRRELLWPLGRLVAVGEGDNAPDRIGRNGGEVFVDFLDGGAKIVIHHKPIRLNAGVLDDRAAATFSGDSLDQPTFFAIDHIAALVPAFILDDTPPHINNRISGEHYGWQQARSENHRT